MDATAPRELDPIACAALVGAACGDCFGCPFEHSTRRLTSWDRQSFAHASPIWTDDTQQALVLVDVYLKTGDLDPGLVMDRFVDMIDAAPNRKFGLHRGTGRGFRHAVEGYRQTGAFAPLADRPGNGAAMRVAPVAVAMRSLPDALDRIDRVSRATHDEPMALDAARAVAAAAIATGNGTRGCDAVLAEVTRQLPSGVTRDSLDSAIGVEDPLATLTRVTGFERGAGHALGSPLSGIILGLTQPTFLDAVRKAVLLGEDTDSTATIAGALVGARDGLGSVPTHLRGFPGYKALRAWTSDSDQIALEQDLFAVLDAIRRV